MYIHFKDKEDSEIKISQTEFKLSNGVHVEIDLSNLTAKIISSFNTEENIFIPRFFENESKQYVIKCIDDKAFYLNTNIKTLTFAEDSEIQSINDFAFSESSIEKLCIPSSLSSLGKKWCSITKKLFNIEVSPSNNFFKKLNDKFLIGKNRLNSPFNTLLFSCRDIKGNVEIPDEIEEISQNAFNNCLEMKSVSFGQNKVLKAIDNMAFFGCTNLEYIESFPSSVSTVGYQAFMFDSKLKSLEFLGDEIQISEEVFYFCSSLSIISFPNASKITLDRKTFAGLKNLLIMVQPGAEIKGINLNIKK